MEQLLMPALEIRTQKRCFAQVLNLVVKVVENLVYGHLSVLIEKLCAQSKCTPSKERRNRLKVIRLQTADPKQNLFLQLEKKLYLQILLIRLATLH